MRAVLDDLAERGTDALRGRNVRFYLREALPAVIASIALPPLLVLLVQFAQRAAGLEPWRPGAWGLAAAMALTALLVAWLVTSWARRLPVDRRSALGLIDRAADAGERLVTADALLASGAPGPFAAAAVEDARWFLKPAQAAEPELPPAPAPTSSLPRGLLYGLAGLALLFSALHPIGVDAGDELGLETAEAPYHIPDRTAPVESPPSTTPDARVPTPPAPAAGARPETKATDAAAPSRPTDLPEEVTRKEGKGG
ncbi:MAG: hypothetical protein P1V36_01420, partial [Planctomycetota bacterium]|nr:hypothetical protein [Planctomycetota bacterium]